MQDNSNIKKIFSRVAKYYDFLNMLLSFGQDRIWRRKCVGLAALSEVPTSTGFILDLAAGTLDLSIELSTAYPQATILALDLSPEMLKHGRAKIQNRKIIPLCGDAYSLPLKDNSIERVTIAFGLRNMSDRARVFAELQRVLVPQGQIYILELNSSRNKIWCGLYNFYLNRILPFIGGLISSAKDYKYLAQSVYNFPHPSELCSQLERAGFTQVKHKRLSFGIVGLYLGTVANNSDLKKYDKL